MGGDESEDRTGWVSVAKLKPEDLLRRATYSKDAGDMAAEAEILKAKYDLLRQRSDVAAKEWWDHLHRTYCIPRNGDYTIKDDGTVLMKPTKKDESNG